MKLVMAICLAFGSLALAADTEFDAHKKMVLDHLAEREKSIAEAKTCATAAQNREEMKKCMENRAGEMKMEREKMIDQRIKALEDKKAKMKEEKK